jgi:hypothetical protein
MKLYFNSISEKNKNLLVLSTIILVVFLFCLPFLQNITYTSINSDWNQMYSYFYFCRNTVLTKFQFPLRCPYFGGGYPLIANPQDLSLSPLFLIILIAGETIGSKIICLLTYLICALGMYYLAIAVLKFSRMGAVFSCLSLTLCSWLPNQLFDGNFAKIYYYFTPLLVICVLQARTNRKFLVYGSIVLAVIFLQAGLSFAAICLFLSILLLFYQAQRFIEINNLKYLFYLILFALLISSVKAFPMAELLYRNLRKVDYSSLQNFSLNTKTLLKSLFEKSYYENSTIYVGYGTIFLSLVAFIFDFKRLRGIFFTLLVMLAILFGSNSIINVSAIIWKVPVFQSMAKLNKYYAFFLAFLLCLSAGCSFNLIQKTSNKKLFIFLAILILIFNTADIFINNISFHNNIFTRKPLAEGNPGSHFSQVLIKNNNTERDAGAYLQYALLKTNQGLINWYGNIYLGESPIPKFFITIKSEKEPFPVKISVNPNYKGELFFINRAENWAKFDRFTPNFIEISGRLSMPDILVINQNFSPCWRTDYGTLLSRKGLLAIKIDRGGEFKIKLTYLPKSFLLGLSVSICSAVFFLFQIKKTFEA